MPAVYPRALIARQGVNGAVNGAKSVVSGGWSKCMSHASCKWPVIIGMIIGGLIILSVLFACIRCLCCGLECCCGCFACCNACCPSPRRKGKKLPQDDNYGYKTSANPNAPQYSAAPARQYESHPPPTYNTGPTYAQFEVPKKGAYARPGNPDALPSMPTWDNAEDRKIESFEDPVEMNDLDHHGQAPGTAGSDTPMIGGAAVGGMRPGMNERTGSNSGYLTPVTERESYVSGATDSPYGVAATGGYRGAAPPPAHRQSPYGTPTQRSPTKQQFGSAPPSSYSAYNPHSGSGSSTPTYPGQRTYQSSQRSPTKMNQSSSTLEPSLDYPRQFRPTQELPEPDAHVEGYEPEPEGGANRKPVNGSWRDV